MRRIEQIIGIAAFMLYIYTAMCMALNFFDSSFQYLTPGVTVIFITTLVSGVLGVFSPFWNTGRYLKISNVKEIVNYETRYRVKYLSLFIGYIGLIFLLRSEKIFDAYWFMGVIMTIWYVIYFVLKVVPRPKL